MTIKPVMQREVAIDTIIQATGYVSLWATPDAAQELAQYGEIYQWEEVANKYTLYVDGRFDFGEVVAYIKSFC